jgi:N-acetylneuraminic acid mutarotase
MKKALMMKVLIVALLLLAGCAAEHSEEIRVTLIPIAANVYITQSVQLTAAVHNSANSAVTWSLSGAGCSGVTCGTISSTGLYTAPESVPSTPSITVKATSVADTSKSASATITILAADNIWTWISGSNVGEWGTYGTRGLAAPSNVPGARRSASSWIDSGGRLWLFGGDGFGSAGNSGFLNDLWRYDPATNEWTWISGSYVGYQPGTYGTKGISDPSNVPGARQLAVSWIDSSGKLWLFGGNGYYSDGNYGELNDLWKYDPTSDEWTWVSGSNEADQPGIYGTKGISDPSSVPGAREGAVSWVDSGGKLWLFGGGGFDSVGTYSILNDLWKYDPASNEWTWVSGNNEGDQVGIYGTRGIAAPSNVPGGKYGAVSWVDPSDKLWLFGGDGVYSVGNADELNDLWKYDPTSNEWTWFSGSDQAHQAGIYGTQGIAASSNFPGARVSVASGIDSGGKLWLFGGYGYGSAGNFGELNDLWKYDPTSNEWAWISGSYAGNQPGIYGTKGISDPSNVPGARDGAVSWFDPSGSLWIFGGYGRDSTGSNAVLNDLWRYNR